MTVLDCEDVVSWKLSSLVVKLFMLGFWLSVLPIEIVKLSVTVLPVVSAAVTVSVSVAEPKL